MPLFCSLTPQYFPELPNLLSVCVYVWVGGLGGGCFRFASKDGGETDVDCGGIFCGPCPSDSSCIVDSDCLYNNCRNPLDSGTATSDASPICTIPPKACPNDCGSNDAQGTCYHESTVHGGTLPPSECPADAPNVVCRARCKCSEGYKGDGCQYTDEEMSAVQAIRQGILEYLQSASTELDVTADILTRQITMLSSVRAVFEEEVGLWRLCLCRQRSVREGERDTNTQQVGSGVDSEYAKRLYVVHVDVDTFASLQLGL